MLQRCKWTWWAAPRRLLVQIFIGVSCRWVYRFLKQYRWLGRNWGGMKFGVQSLGWRFPVTYLCDADTRILLPEMTPCEDSKVPASILPSVSSSFPASPKLPPRCRHRSDWSWVRHHWERLDRVQNPHCHRTGGCGEDGSSASSCGCLESYKVCRTGNLCWFCSTASSGYRLRRHWMGEEWWWTSDILFWES